MKPKFDLIGITVSDMPATLKFYRRLGFDIPLEADSRPHVEHILEGGLRFGFDKVEIIQSFDPEYVLRPEYVGAFLLGSPAEVDQLHAELVAEGYTTHHDPWDTFWGQRYAIIKDPDGHLVDLFAPLEQS
jgi:catechol 2,3-dioxygenase-like lactoylglutathione lyase family enzyme